MMAEACSAVEEWLSAYLDGELDARRRAEVQAHLDSCPACRRELDTLRSSARLLDAWCVPEVTPQVSVVFADRLAAQQARQPWWSAWLGTAGGRRIAWPLAAGVALLALCIWAPFHPGQREARVIPHHGEITPQPTVKLVAHKPDTAVEHQPITASYVPTQHDAKSSRRHHAHAKSTPVLVAKGGEERHDTGVRTVSFQMKDDVTTGINVTNPDSVSPPTAPSMPDASSLAFAMLTETPAASETAPVEGGFAEPAVSEDVYVLPEGDNAVLVNAELDEGPDRLLARFIAETD